MQVPAKNISTGPQILMYGGETRTIEPGQTTLLPMDLAIKWMETRRDEWRMDFHGLNLKTFDEGHISYSSAVNRTTGYGKQGYYILRNMMRSGLSVHFQQISGYTLPSIYDIDTQTADMIMREDREVTDWGLVHSVVEALENMPTPKTIIWSMWEADILPDHRPSGPYSRWAEKINRYSRAVIVPATEQRAIFERSGVEKPIYVVHDAVDPTVWTYKERSFPRHRPFTFFVWAFMNSRKAPWETVNSFLSAFGPNNPNVRLICKTVNQFGGGRSGIPKNLGVNNVQIIDARWTEDDLLSFIHNEVDACFFLSKGEGFYDPPLEALSTGLPVIVPDHSGPHDYADPDYVYPVQTKMMVPAPQGEEYMKWWIPDYDHAIHQLREIYNNYDTALAKARRGSQWVADRWSVEHQRQDLMDVLEQICHD